MLLARIYEVLPLLCPKCGGEMKIIAFINEAVVIREILNHLGEPTSPPMLKPARGPPLWEMQGVEPDESDPQAQPAPDLSLIKAWHGRERRAVARHGATRAWGHVSDKFLMRSWSQICITGK